MGVVHCPQWSVRVCVCVCVCVYERGCRWLACATFLSLHSRMEWNVVCSSWGLGLAKMHVLGFFLGKLMRERGMGGD